MKYVQICRYLLDRYPDHDVKLTANGWTTTHYVAGQGMKSGNEIEIFEMLLNSVNQVNIMYHSKNGNSVLTLAIKYNVCEFAEYLFENHRNLLHILNANDPSEISNEHPKMLEILHKYLAKPYEIINCVTFYFVDWYMYIWKVTFSVYFK